MDIVDHAAELEVADRERALRRSRAQPVFSPVLRDGERVCIDCGDPIPLTRLDRVPAAVRCRDCQAVAERSPT